MYPICVTKPPSQDWNTNSLLLEIAPYFATVILEKGSFYACLVAIFEGIHVKFAKVKGIK